jgi:hypothetical protein
MSSSFISLSRTPEALSEAPVSMHGDEVSQTAKTLLVPPPPAPRKARPKRAPGASVPPPPRGAKAEPEARAAAGATRKARKPSTLPIPSTAEAALKATPRTDNHWEVDLKDMQQIAGDVDDDDLGELDFEPGDWETTGMRLRRHARRLLELATKRKH